MFTLKGWKIGEILGHHDEMAHTQSLRSRIVNLTMCTMQEVSVCL